jgi:hypothetical protein
MPVSSKLQVNKIVGTLANMGVIVGLVLVAYQINQAIEITRAQLINDYYIADMQLEMKMMGENPGESFAKAVFDEEALTQQDLAVLDRYFNYGMVQLTRLREMQELGYVSETDLQKRIDYLGWHLGNPAGRRWWEEYKKDNSDELIQAVEKVLRERPIEENRQMLDAMSKKLANDA